jgi:hypothetical protein
MEFYEHCSTALLLHEEISPVGWRGLLLFAVGLAIFVKLIDELARRAVKGNRGKKRPRF